MTAVSTPRAGRPRSAEADEAILRAAVDHFAERGYDGLSMEAVAEAAGVAKSTVYRRYQSKADLIMAARELCTSCVSVDTVDTGTLEGDLFEMARNLRGIYSSSDIGRTFPATLMAAAHNPEFARAHHAFIAERRAGVIATIQRGIDRGELPADTDAELLVDLIVGPIFYRVFNTGASVEDDALRPLIAAALRAMGATPAT